MQEKNIWFGICLICKSECRKIMRYLDDPSTARGITLEYGLKETGYWVWCANTECENHHGEGTLKSRPHNIE